MGAAKFRRHLQQKVHLHVMGFVHGSAVTSLSPINKLVL